MTLFRFRTRLYGVIVLNWWFPEAGLVLWIGGVMRWKMWGTGWGFRSCFT